MDIKITKLLKGSIFCEEFSNLQNNNVISFGNKRVGIVYGPNGTGKTSLAKVFGQEENTQYSVEINEDVFTEESDRQFHIISDQNGRNIIIGETTDFILGDNLQREYELKEKIEKIFDKLFKNELPTMLKKYGIKTKEFQLGNFFFNDTIKKYVSDLVNIRSKGNNIDRDEFVNTICEMLPYEIADYNENKLAFFVGDYSSKNSIIRTLLSHEFSFDESEKQICKLEESNEAVKILEKYKHLDECLICDTKIDVQKLTAQKNENKKFVLQSLDPKAKMLAEQIIEKLSMNDSFDIKSKLRKALNENCNEGIVDLNNEIVSYGKLLSCLINNEIIAITNQHDIKTIYEEYDAVRQDQLKLEDEDIIFIEKFLNDCLEKDINLQRDDDGNIKLLLGEDEFLNKDRERLFLSNGEQNFLSLAFELLKAKKVPEKIIILDDPISSFDSIYKNKIAFAILKILGDKYSIILTHTTDLIKLLEHQRKDSFVLYYFNNTMNANNGFIAICRDEIDILLYVHMFLELLREGIREHITNERNFVISVIPFLRGYCQLLGRMEEKNKLTIVMHGYKTERVNMNEIFEVVLGANILTHEHVISAEDIIALDHENFECISSEVYPLLAKTLRHTMTYLFLRLNVEKVLVEKFTINVNKNQMLAQIIHNSFPGDSDESIENRVFFLSRKTLLNEFNHFEMDMNIFQPAIDITEQTLKKETDMIIERLDEIDTNT